MKRKIIMLFPALAAAIMCAAACAFTLTACGNTSGGKSVNGTYYLIHSGEIDKETYIKLDSGKWNDSDFESGEYKLSGETITLYEVFFGEKDVYGKGTLINGVLALDMDENGSLESKYCSAAHKHNYGKWETVSEVSCMIDGKEERTCDCSVKESKITAQRIGYHSFDEWEITETYHAEICSVCSVMDNVGLHESKSKCSICGYPLQYSLNADKTSYTLKAFHQGTGNVKIPAEFNGLPVTAIAENVFKNCDILSSITIPDSVTSIGRYAFNGCTGIKSIYYTGDIASWCDIDGLDYLMSSSRALYIDGKEITGDLVIPDGVTAIGKYAFYGCSGLTSVTIPGSVTSIGDYAFGGCPIETATIPAIAASYIRNSALKTVVITSGDTIGEYAFSGCSGLTSVTIPDSVTSIGEGAFLNCRDLGSIYVEENNTVYASYDGVLYNKTKTEIVFVPKAIKGAITIPDGVTSIGDDAFRDCNSLTSVNIGNGVTSIGSSAFYGCSGLTSVTIGNIVTSIGKEAFYNCSSLTSVNIGNGVTSIGNEAFYNCSGLTNVTIPNGVTSIGESAFSGCSGLESFSVGENNTAYASHNGVLYNKAKTEIVLVPKAIKGAITIPDSVTSIGRSAFSGCSGLTSVTIPDSVTSVGNYAFKDCSGLTSVTIPDSVTSIGYKAFYNCTGLTSITIPDSVTYIDEWAFDNCSGLTSIHYTGDIAGWCGISGLDNLMSSSRTLYIDNKELTGDLVIPNGVTSIGEDAFSGCSKLTSITIPDSVNSIGYYAFYGCSSLTSITIPFVGATKDGTKNTHFGYIFGASICSYNSDRVPALLKSVIITGGKTIGNDAFRGCSGLTSITIPNSVTAIGNDAFRGCSGLTSIHYTGDIAGWCGISGLDNLMSSSRALYIDGKEITGDLVIPDGVTAIGKYAFYGCTGLTSVTIPGSVTSIGDYAFGGCPIETATIPAIAASYIRNSALQTVVITSGDTIGSGAFWNCTSLTSITIPDSVTSIGSSAFYKCTGLTGVTIGNGVTSIGSSAFYKCTGLTGVTIGNGVTSIGSSAFESCSNLTSITIPFVGATKDGTSNTYFGYIFGASSYSDNLKYVPASLKTVIITGGKTIGSSAFYKCTGLTGVTIGNGVNSIDSSAFESCSNLTSITVPDSVNSIGYYAFYGCSNLTSITIPDNVTSIGESAFSGCTGLTSITVASGNTKYHSAGNCLIATAKKTLILGCKASIIPTDGSVTSIGNDAFNGCSGLTSITIPNSVTSIGWYAFRGCSGLTSITIPNSVTSIGNSAFESCSGLTSITVPDSVTSIDSSAFESCRGLTSITIPDSVTSIGWYAFRNCTELTSIDFKGTKAQWNAINKGSDWNSGTGNYTVQCTDGIIYK